MADEDRNVTITISAKNLTENEFKKVRKGLEGISGHTDKTSKKAGVLTRAFSSFGKAAPGAFKAVAIGAGAAAGAVVAVTTAVMKLGERGAAVADVKTQFDALSQAAGETGAVMLSELQAGVKGTISNFDLMKVANKALGAGLLSSAEDARTLSEGARLLGKRTGTDTVQAFNTLTTAMASGRTAQLKQIGLFVDNKQAIEDYAKATGKSVSQMNDADRAAALQSATMAALRSEISNFPPPLADFGELLERGRVGVKNLVDDLAVAVSNSPVFLAGMRAAGDAISKAFGGDSQGLILAIVNGLEKAAFFAIGFARAGVSAAQMVTQGWAGIKVLIYGTALALSELATGMTNTAATVLQAASNVPGFGESLGGAAEKARALAAAGEQVNAGLRQQVADATVAALGQDSLGQALERGKQVLDGINQSMVNAGLSTRDYSAATQEATTVTSGAAASAVQWNVDLSALPPVMTDLQGNIIKTKEEIALFDEETDAHFANTREAVDIFKGRVMGLGDVVYASSQEMSKAFGFFGMKTREELQETAKQAEENFNKIKDSGKASAEELQKIWEQVEEAKRTAQGETETFTLSSNEAIFSGSSQVLNTLGTKYKAAAIAQAIIATGQAVAKSLAAAPWPANLILAAGALAAGMANVNKIRSANAYEEGTPRLDFENFGRESVARLHGFEAVVPQGGGHMLGREVAAELARIRPADGNAELAQELRGMFGELRSLPIAIQRSVRDGIMLSSVG